MILQTVSQLVIVIAATVILLEDLLDTHHTFHVHIHAQTHVEDNVISPNHITTLLTMTGIG